ncbi:MAG: 50S ribosomal protein L17 [Bacteroidales bacterium]|nr:50S ribosomal protein L17 [Bacteroidales bacterium]
MRHRKGFKQLSRKTGHRRAMLANMAASLIKHKRIITTTTKAKALRGYIEPLITKSKDDTTHSRRVVFSYLQDKDAVSELFRDVSPKIMERPGGYTRILKLDNRMGDNAEMAMIELVDFNESLLAETSSKTAASRRRRRGGSKKKDEAAETVAAVAGAKKEAAAASPEKTVELPVEQPEAVVEVQEEVAEVENAVEEMAGEQEAGNTESGQEDEKQDENESEEKKDS